MIICLVEGGLGLPVLDPLVNWGMNSLYERLELLGTCHRLQYENYLGLTPLLRTTDKTVCIGYSGGASRLTMFNTEDPWININLMVLYDPSPSWQMKPIGPSVNKVISYENVSVETAMMPSPYGMLGAGRVTLAAGNNHTTLSRHTIAEQHLAVQHDEALHTMTLAAIKELGS